MQYDENTPRSNQDEHAANKAQAGGYRVENDHNGVEEKDLRRSAILGQGKMHNVHEGLPMGGHKFQQDGNPTPLGDDPANPSRYAGYTNAYFARTAPSEEYPENNNFKPVYQQGAPDYEAAHTHIDSPQKQSEQQMVGEPANTRQVNRSNTPDFSHQADYGNRSFVQEREHIET
ncbi:hypothetical protein C8P68_107146 [Mucilaginibacter yixingensis]|uniref:Uncharacterized protein n=1 Tax=Mucilaginibacter yixingensis TaxID=1295612 RepID=A0A2T5J6C0_9SPHI|nr:hypothetical protein [Mucilaginibacter yixingensis]PTQ94083.1 hypothetical protein C8P68_107146 [Mucilaginibacter yixingensis]